MTKELSREQRKALQVLQENFTVDSPITPAIRSALFFLVTSGLTRDEIVNGYDPEGIAELRAREALGEAVQDVQIQHGFVTYAN